MFLDFLYHLRGYGLKISTTEFLTLIEALVKGHDRASLSNFYALARTVLIKKEGDYDLFDRAFASYFEGVEDHFDVSDELMQWLQNAKLPPMLSEEQMAEIQQMDWDTLREEFEKRLREQKERHDGGNHWIGTGGTSPFGHGGHNPAGIRVGGSGGGRSAVAVAGDRRFRNLRSDRTLDTRQIGTALLRLRRLSKDSALEELNIDETIDASARTTATSSSCSPPRVKTASNSCCSWTWAAPWTPTQNCRNNSSAPHTKRATLKSLKATSSTTASTNNSSKISADGAARAPKTCSHKWTKAGPSSSSAMPTCTPTS